MTECTKSMDLDYPSMSRSKAMSYPIYSFTKIPIHVARETWLK